MTEQNIDLLSFEQANSELKEIIEQMAGQGLTLEQSLTQFERGIKLIKINQQKLQQAEQKVKILLDDQLQDFIPPQEN